MHTLAQLKNGQLAGVTRLALSEGLSDFPREIFDLADTLEILDLSGNALSALPDDLYRLRRLRVLFCSNNRFTELPACLGPCTELTMVAFKANRIRTVPAEALPSKLRWLILTDNAIEVLPETIGQCHDLQKLMLAGNRLSTLPSSMANLHRLELLRLSANAFRILPPWLASLPRLAWLAFAGNPLTANREAQAVAANGSRTIDWADLGLGDVLGEGASGVIRHATWRLNGQGTPVAVKLFKGAVTSDGWPHSEMTACLGAGRHPNLIPVLGRISDAPDGRDALAMTLLDDRFKPLAGPPSFATCTRDVYDDRAVFTAAEALRIATGMASVAAHLHAHGLMHGDFYAHNILYDGHEAVIGDFGAAAFYDPGEAMAQALLRIEVRAFGCLVEELAERCANAGVAASLRRLADDCLAPEVAGRPDFATIVERLRTLNPASHPEIL